MTYLHTNRQSLYNVIHPRITIQTDQLLRDMDQLVLYRAQSDGSLWGRPPAEFLDRFETQAPDPYVGDPAQKVSGYPFPGEIRSVFWTRAGHRRFVVEATGQDYAGMLHIFNGEQLGIKE